MLSNFLKLTFRNLYRNKTYVIINICGMGLSLACCIVAYLNFDLGYSFDKHHENIDNLYKVHVNKQVQGEFIPYGITPLALMPSAKDELSGVKMSSRYVSTGLTLKKGDEVLEKSIGFVDKDYLDMFTYPLRYGDKESIHEIGNIILSAETSEIYFGDQNPVGEFISIITNKEEVKSFKITGVFEEYPSMNSMNFEGLMAFDNYLDIYDLEKNTWKRFVSASFIYVDDKTKLSNIKQELNKFIPIQNKARTDWLIHDFELIPLEDLGAVARDIRSNWISSAPHPAATYSPPIMGLLMLLIACFNFTNTSIAISTKRLKEIVVRKVMGSSRKQLIVQFMFENIVLCTISLILGMAIAVWLVPAYAALWQGMVLEFNPLENYKMLGFLFGLLIFTAVVAGAYPSYFVSAYQPIGILQGSFKLGGSKKLTNSLLTLQYVFTVIALFASVAFYRNAQYQKNMDMGFNKETVVYTNVNNADEANLLADRLRQNPKVLSLSATSQHIGRWTYSRTLSQQEFQLEADVMDFGKGYFETMDLKLITGRIFDESNWQYDKENSVIVNETLANEFGWENPIGQRVALNDSIRLTVVGVVNDFYNNGFFSEIEPVAIRPSKDDRLYFVVAKATKENVQDVLSFMEEEMYTISPNRPFEGDYQEEIMKQSVTVNENIMIIFSFLGILAVILSTIGLFTLVSLNVTRRIKEIGIRKVLGASIGTIIGLLNRPYLVMLMIASALGVGLAYLITDGLISSIFTYHQKADWITFALPILMIFLVSLLVSSGRIFESASKNPTESLRYE